MSPKPSRKLDPWFDHACDVIRRARPTGAEPYRKRGRDAQYHHFRQVSLDLFERFHDGFPNTAWPLAQAAFLHGLPYNWVETHRRRLKVSEETTRILWQRERIRGQRPDDDVELALALDVLPSVEWPAVVLTLVEQLDHVAHREALEAWTRSFAQTPSQPVEKALKNWVPARANDQWHFRFVSEVLRPLAKLVGWRAEYRQFGNAVLMHQKWDRFAELAEFAAAETGPGTASAAFVEMVRGTLGGEWTTPRMDGHAYWTWHHVASISEALGKVPRHRLGRYIARCGQVTLHAASRIDSYTLLGQLHEAFTYRPGQVEDSIGQATHDGYRALHTVVVLKDDEYDHAVRVRILPYPPDEPPVSSLRAQVDRITQSLRPSKGDEIVVYTPSNEARRVSRRATVLDFGMVISPRFIGRIEYALINGERSDDLLQRLRAGDRVELKIGETVRGLPAGWEDRVVTADTIRQAWASNLDDSHAARGRRWLKIDLQRRGANELDDKVIDLLVDEALARLRQQFANTAPWDASTRSWLRALGELDAVRSGDMSLGPHLPSDHELQGFERMVCSICDEFVAGRPADLADGAQLRKQATCYHCTPRRTGKVLISIAERGDFSLHTPDCNVGATHGHLLHWAPHHDEAPPVIAIRTTNRVDVLFDTLQVFRDLDLVILAAGAQTRSITLSLLVYQVRRLPADKRTPLFERLSAVAGVVDVSGIFDVPDPALTRLLPRSGTVSSTIPIGRVYEVGPPVQADDQFYGRADALHKLESVRVRSQTHGLVHLRGPFRMGKSSLALAYLRQRREDPYLRVATAYAQRNVREGWPEVRDALKDALWRSAEGLQRATGSTLPPQPQTLDEVLDYLAAQKVDVIIAIDEILGLLWSCNRDAEGQKGFERLMQRIQRQPGWMALLVGPSIPPVSFNWAFSALLKDLADVEVKAFTKDEVRTVLEAQQRPDVFIKADPEAVELAWAWCRGDPALTVELAQILLEITRGADEWRHYTARRARHALKRMQVASAVLARRAHDRLDWLDDTSLQPAQQAVLAQFEARWRAQSGDAPFDLPTAAVAPIKLSITDIAQAAGLPVERARAAALALEWRGAIAHQEADHFEMLPLVAQYAADRLDIFQETP